MDPQSPVRLGPFSLKHISFLRDSPLSARVFLWQALPDLADQRYEFFPHYYLFALANLLILQKISSYFYSNIFLIIPSTTWGFALPFVSRIIIPIKNLIGASLPFFISVTAF